MNEADLYTIFEQHGSVQLYVTRSAVYDLHAKVDYLCFSCKSYPLPVLIFLPNVVPLCGSKSTRVICGFPMTVSLKIRPHCQGFKGSREHPIHLGINKGRICDSFCWICGMYWNLT